MNGKILIVDDEKNIRLALTAALETLPVQVEAVASGEEALAKVEKQPYDYKLWLLDLLMPGIDGMEVITAACYHPSGYQGHSHNGARIHRNRGGDHEVGGGGFLTKPFDPEEIRSAISRLLAWDSQPDQQQAAYTSLLELAKNRLEEHRLEADPGVSGESHCLEP